MKQPTPTGRAYLALIEARLNRAQTEPERLQALAELDAYKARREADLFGQVPLAQALKVR